MTHYISQLLFSLITWDKQFNPDHNWIVPQGGGWGGGGISTCMSNHSEHLQFHRTPMWTLHAHWPLSASSCHSHSSPDSFSSETSSWPPAPVAPLPPRTSLNSGRNPYRWTGSWTLGLDPPPPPPLSLSSSLSRLSFCPPSFPLLSLSVL